MRMISLSDQSHNINFSLVEPTDPLKGAVARFLEYSGGSGVHHFAYHVNNIIEAVTKARERGLEFLAAPSKYYHERKQEVAIPLKFSWHELEQNHILLDPETVDKFNETGIDGKAVLYQIFALPIDKEFKMGVFCELIQRDKGAIGFGQGNVTALYRALSKTPE